MIGITGGIGSGKSTVAGMLARLGADMIDADAIAHDALDRDDVRRAIGAAWGPGVFDAAGRVDRKALASAVFHEEEQTRRLNAIVHPPVLAEIHRRLKASQAKAVVIDAALLVESGLDRHCDVVLFVDAPEAAQRERVAARGWTDRELRRREAQQLPLDAKRRRSRYVIENGTTQENTFRQVVEFWNESFK